MSYWQDLFTAKTWEEFRNAGARISGFRDSQRASARQIQPGDILICYLTGVMHWVGALRVLGPSQDKSPIWDGLDFPVRFEVEPIVVLAPEYGVPMEDLLGKVDFYEKPEDRRGFRGFLRRTPLRFKRDTDGDFILDLLKKAEATPVKRQIDPRRLKYAPLFIVEQRRGTKKIAARVSVPDAEEDSPSQEPAGGEEASEKETASLHTEIQYHLLNLGAEMGLIVWVAKGDRGKAWNGKRFGDLPGMVEKLPSQFNEATTRTIEQIDVLWIKGNSIHAAFEVECTTSVYSGLLRMSDLLALQPNIDIRLFIVAPDERREKVQREILRPTFQLRERPLHEICGFLPYSDLVEKVEGIQRLELASSLKPDFLEKTAEYFGDESGE